MPRPIYVRPLTDDERAELQDLAGGTKLGVLERATFNIKRFCVNPFFGGSAKGPEILAAPSQVPTILA